MKKLIKKVFRTLYFRIRAIAGVVPVRKDIDLKNSIIHESVDIEKVKLGGYNGVNKNCVISGDVTLGRYTTIGVGSLIRGGKITIGNYCQIGPYCAVYATDHPTEYLTSYNSKILFGGELKILSKELVVSIGNGVWFGHGAIVLKGVSIGNGAVIGAGAVVVKDVKPYEIVVGNPARSLGLRFTEDVIEEIEKSNWWMLDHKQLEGSKTNFHLNLKAETIDSIRSAFSSFHK